MILERLQDIGLIHGIRIGPVDILHKGESNRFGILQIAAGKTREWPHARVLVRKQPPLASQQPGPRSVRSLRVA